MGKQCPDTSAASGIVHSIICPPKAFSTAGQCLEHGKLPQDIYHKAKACYIHQIAGISWGFNKMNYWKLTLHKACISAV